MNTLIDILSWFSTASPNFILASLFAMITLPIVAAINRGIERQVVRKVLYDDLANSYIRIVLNVEDIKVIWRNKAKLEFPIFEELFSSIHKKDHDQEDQKKEKARKKIELEVEKNNILSSVIENLKMINLKRYQSLESQKILVLFELTEYRKIDNVFEKLKNFQEGGFNKESIYHDIGRFKACIAQLNPRYLKCSIKRMAAPEEKDTVLNALKSDLKVDKCFIYYD
jgi:hypothetical protein